MPRYKLGVFDRSTIPPYSPRHGRDSLRVVTAQGANGLAVRPLIASREGKP